MWEYRQARVCGPSEMSLEQLPLGLRNLNPLIDIDVQAE